MRHVLTLLCLLVTTPARADTLSLVEDKKYGEAMQVANTPLLQTYVQWAALRDPEASTPIPFADGYTFLAKHPNWPDEKTIRLRTEQAALEGEAEKSTLHQFCNRFPPISGRGMFACAGAGVGTAQQRKEWMKQGWQQGDFSEYEEQFILETFGSQLTAADHIARMDRLLFEDKTGHAQRMLRRVPRERETLYLARIALIKNERNANAKLNSVPVNLKNDPGLIFDRIQWRAKRKDKEGVHELLLSGPKNPPYADLWWKYRGIAVREALADKRYKEAVKLLAERGELKAEAMADALFLKGWIGLSYLKDTHGAYRDFYKLYTAVTTPVSKARAAYWAAEAARLNGNAEIQREWLEKAATRPLTFYGQLAFAKLHPGTRLPLPLEPNVPKFEEANFLKDEQVQLIYQLATAGQEAMADKFLMNMAAQATLPSRFVLLVRLAHATRDNAGAVRVAKQALRKGVVLIQAGWPVLPIPQDAAIEPALALAIIRQESEFDPRAVSSAGARGLMQLMPKTALTVARKHDIRYTRHDIELPAVNVALGTTYLGEMIRAMENSYVMGIAAYNAGPGNVWDWEEAFGRPGDSPEDAVHWIENIPFGETRNYVMRVLENLQIYRQLLHATSQPQLNDDLVR